MRPAAGGQGAGAALLYPGISLAYMVGGQAHIHQIEGDRLRITYCRAGQLVWEQDGGQRHLAPGDFAVQGGAAPGETTPETRPSGDFAGLSLSVDLQEAAACPAFYRGQGHASHISGPAGRRLKRFRGPVHEIRTGGRLCRIVYLP